MHKQTSMPSSPSILSSTLRSPRLYPGTRTRARFWRRTSENWLLLLAATGVPSWTAGLLLARLPWRGARDGYARCKDGRCNVKWHLCGRWGKLLHRGGRDCTVIGGRWCRSDFRGVFRRSRRRRVLYPRRTGRYGDVVRVPHDC